MVFTALEVSRAHTATGSIGDQGGAITAATNATPIVITTTSPHNLKDGDPIQITGVGGNTNANTTGFAKRTGYSATTFGVYADAALATAVAGNSGYTSGGVVSQAIDISGVSNDWDLFLRIEGMTAGKKAIVALQDSADGFVSDVVTLYTWNIQGKVTTDAMKDGDRIRKYDIPSARFGAASARLRFRVLQIDSAATLTVTCGYQS